MFDYLNKVVGSIYSVESVCRFFIREGISALKKTSDLNMPIQFGCSAKI